MEIVKEIFDRNVEIEKLSFSLQSFLGFYMEILRKMLSSGNKYPEILCLGIFIYISGFIEYCLNHKEDILRVCEGLKENNSLKVIYLSILQ